MKSLIRVAVFFPFALFVHAADYGEGIKYALGQLGSERSKEGLMIVGGRSSDAGGVHGTFYLLYPFFFSRATPTDVGLMLQDQNPVVRILGARRVLDPFLRPLPVEAIEFLRRDETKVRVGPIYPGGDFKTMTVGAVIDHMKQDPEFLFKPYSSDLIQMDPIREVRPLSSVQPLERPLPVFPFEMARARVGGFVVVRFTVTPEGSTSDFLIVKSSQREFEGAAKAAVARWKFSRPAANTDGVQESPMLECRFNFSFAE